MYLWRVKITYYGWEPPSDKSILVMAPDEEAAKKAAEEKAREPYDSARWDIERLDEVDGHTITVDAAQRVADLEADAAKMREAVGMAKGLLKATRQADNTIHGDALILDAEHYLAEASKPDAGRAFAEEHERYREALVVIAEGPGARYPQSSVGQWAAEIADAALRGGGAK